MYKSFGCVPLRELDLGVEVALLAWEGMQRLVTSPGGGVGEFQVQASLESSNDEPRRA